MNVRNKWNSIFISCFSELCCITGWTYRRENSNTASNYHERCEFELPCRVAISPWNSMEVCHERQHYGHDRSWEPLNLLCESDTYSAGQEIHYRVHKSRVHKSSPVVLSLYQALWIQSVFCHPVSFTYWFSTWFPHVFPPKRRMLISFLVCMWSLYIPLDSVAWQNHWKICRFPILWNYFRYGIWLIRTVRVAAVRCLRCQFSFSKQSYLDG
jgi:hypothetical protein